MKRKMNTRSKKALSPVVASIILIAVTVAVSIAVAAWMGALSFNFMATEQGQITNMVFTNGDTITLTFQNTGTTPITINEVWVNGVQQTFTPTTVDGNTAPTIALTYTYSQGFQYEVKLVSAKGNAFLRTGVAPA
jgi:archaeal type IV pilus assembly protein PilA